MTICCCAGALQDEHGAGNTHAGDDAGTVAAAEAGQQAARGTGEPSTLGTPCTHAYAVMACGGVISMSRALRVVCTLSRCTSSVSKERHASHSIPPLPRTCQADHDEVRLLLGGAGQQLPGVLGAAGTWCQGRHIKAQALSCT
jgi:hypothetical protein